MIDALWTVLRNVGFRGGTIMTVWEDFLADATVIVGGQVVAADGKVIPNQYPGRRLLGAPAQGR